MFMGVTRKKVVTSATAVATVNPHHQVTGAPTIQSKKNNLTKNSETIYFHMQTTIGGFLKVLKMTLVERTTAHK